MRLLALPPPSPPTPSRYLTALVKRNESLAATRATAAINPSASERAGGRQRQRETPAPHAARLARPHGEPRPRLLLLRVPTPPRPLRLRRTPPRAPRRRAAAGVLRRRRRAERGEEAQAPRRRRGGGGSSRIQER